MTTRTLADIAKKLRKIDIAMLSTHTEGGQIAGRPMSNNGDVEYDGDSYYFTMDSTRMVRDIAGDPRVSLGFTGSKGLHVAVQGQAELIRDRAAFAEHWNPDLDRWFADGIDTPGLTMIKVHATRIHYWDGEENGEIAV